VKSPAREGVRWALAGCVLALAGGCGDDPRPPDVDLHVWAAWADDAASSAEIGYEVRVVSNMPDRAESCFPLPALQFTVNDIDYATAAGDCDADVSVIARAVRADADTVVTLRSAHGPMGTATFQGLFPGFGASQLVSPADGRVRMGEKLAISIPPGWPVGDGRVSAAVHWLDPAPSVPPFYSYVIGNANVDRTAVELTMPMLTGRAQVILEDLRFPEMIDSTSCSGFARCFGHPSTGVLGPVAIEVIP
jgi:hypothetical protein